MDDNQAVAERYAFGCAALLIVALAIGLGVIVLGWLFGIGLRLSGV